MCAEKCLGDRNLNKSGCVRRASFSYIPFNSRWLGPNIKKVCKSISALTSMSLIRVLSHLHTFFYANIYYTASHFFVFRRIHVLKGTQSKNANETYLLLSIKAILAYIYTITYTYIISFFMQTPLFAYFSQLVIYCGFDLISKKSK